VTAPLRAPSVNHYENFPVASWLCPPQIRPAVVAIYRFARTADDIADEGDAAPQQRLEQLAAYRADLLAIGTGQAHSGRWRAIFDPLSRVLAQWSLPLPSLFDLLDAFEQDVRKTRDRAGYADRAELLDYCSRSANPVGRLMLHLYGVDDAASTARSDSICTALQLINFWQDIGQDLARGRRYLPEADCLSHGVDPRVPDSSPPRKRAALVRQECAWARGLMLEGAPLVHRVPGRAGWELRAVVQGGLRILDRIEAIGYDTFHHRPRLRISDALPIGVRMMRM
jgi:hydroxysqualene synthase